MKNQVNNHPESKEQLLAIIQNFEAKFTGKIIDEFLKTEIEGKLKELSKIALKFDKDDLVSVIKMSNNIMFLTAMKPDTKLDFIDVLVNTNSGNLIKKFIEHLDSFSDSDYWYYLSYCYSQQDYNPADYNILHPLFLSNRNKREMLMDENERDTFLKLPSELTIYRCMPTSEAISKKYRISWTLDSKIAEFFENRYKFLNPRKKFEIVSLLVSKEKLICYLNSRNEQEVIYIHEG